MEFLQIPMVTRRLALKLTQQQKLAPAAAPMMLDLRLSGGPGLVPGEPEHSDRSGQEWVLEEDWMKPQSQVDRFLPKAPWRLWSSATFLYLWEGTLNCGSCLELPAGANPVQTEEAMWKVKCRDYATASKSRMSAGKSWKTD